MAGVAEHAAGVFGRRDLRKSSGLGRVLLMAACAENGYIRQHGLEAGGIIGMLRLRPVTGLAGNMGVFAGGAGLGFVIVTEDARVLAGEGERPLADQIQCRGTIVAVLAEGFRNNGAPNHQESSQPSQQNRGRADEMAGISKKPHHHLGKGGAQHVPDQPGGPQVSC